MRATLRRAWAISCLLLPGGPICCQAASPSRDEVSRLLESAANNAPRDVETVRAEYGRLKRAHPGEARIDYLYAVALIKQRRYADAIPALAQYLARHPDDAGALRTKIHADLGDRQYEQALKDAVALAEKLPEPAERPARDGVAQARFLGTVFGYLELARGRVVDKELYTEARSRVLAAVGETSLNAFDAGRRQVAERLAELEKEQQEKQALADAEIDQQQAAVQESLEIQHLKIAADNEAMQNNVERLRDAQRQLDVLRRQIAALERDRAQLTVQMIAAQSELLELQQDVNFDSPRRPTVSIDTAARLAQWNLILTGLNRQAFRNDEKLAALRAQAARLGVQGSQEARQIAASRATLDEVRRRAKMLDGRARRLENRRPARRAITAQMKRFSTYLPFPFEEEQRRVLGWFE